MEHWNVALCDPAKNDGAKLFLLNRSKTLVSVHKRLRFDPIILFKRLEAVRFPVKYTEGLERIHFTIIPGTTAGYYIDNKIWVDVSQASIDSTMETFMHEVGHHVDEEECVAPFLHDERMKRSKHLHEIFSTRSDDEYLALGFEKFYSENPINKRELRKRNPLLYRTIQLLNRDYRKG